MKPKVYIETTIASYLTARPSADLIVAAHQQLTDRWWQERRGDFYLFTSQPVLEEAGRGNAETSALRLELLEALPSLEVMAAAVALAKDLVRTGPLPEKAEVDALHIAVAATNRMAYLLTWNCKHLANAAMRNKIEQVSRIHGYEPVIICTPAELMEV